MPVTRIALLSLLVLIVGGCAAAQPGDPAVTNPDQTWLKQRGLFDRFDASATDFHPLNAYLLSLAVRAGDMNTAEQRETLRTWGFRRHTPIVDRNASVYAYVASNDRMVLAVFSGTDIRNIRDLESDVDALYPIQRERYSRAEGALLHRGFASNLDAVWEPVTMEVASQAKARGDAPAKPVWIVGHSRGGAFATLAASGWAQQGDVRIAGLYTFGQPRVGNAQFASHFASLGVPYFRVINERDAVAGVPLRIGSLGTDYAHAGTVAHLTAGPMLRKDPPPASLRLIAIDPDHYLDGYIAKLYAVVTQPQRIEDATWRAMAVEATPTPSPATTRSTIELPRPPWSG
jgi:triacylglycerol lipase